MKDLIIRTVRFKPKLKLTFFNKTLKHRLKSLLHQRLLDNKEDGSEDESTTEESGVHQHEDASILVNSATYKNVNPSYLWHLLHV